MQISKRFRLIGAGVLVAVLSSAASFVMAQTGKSQIRVQEKYSLAGSDPDGKMDQRQLTIICDAPRGNLVYVAVSERYSGANASLPIAITVVHDPASCKVQ